MRGEVMMAGITLEEILDAILDAFDEDELRILLRVEMNVRMDNILKPGAFRMRVFNLIEWSEREGRTTELVQVTSRARPRVAAMQQIGKKYGLSIPCYVETGGAPASTDTTDAADSGLEALVKPHLSFADF